MDATEGSWELAKLNLYFYNPETEKSILADTMTVNVKAASPTASSVPGSAYAGDIVSSGAADDIVKQERLSLATSAIYAIFSTDKAFEEQAIEE